jgi:hypothetical protein
VIVDCSDPSHEVGVPFEYPPRGMGRLTPRCDECMRPLPLRWLHEHIPQLPKDKAMEYPAYHKNVKFREPGKPLCGRCGRHEP